MEPNDKRNDVTYYDVHIKNNLGDVRFEHTPEFSIKTRQLLAEEGFFRAFKLFQNGAMINQLDTADYYLTLKYSTNLFVLTPVTKDSELKVRETISTDRNLSHDLRITKK